MGPGPGEDCTAGLGRVRTGLGQRARWTAAPTHLRPPGFTPEVRPGCRKSCLFLPALTGSRTYRQPRDWSSVLCFWPRRGRGGQPDHPQAAWLADGPARLTPGQHSHAPPRLLLTGVTSQPHPALGPRDPHSPPLQRQPRWGGGLLRSFPSAGLRNRLRVTAEPARPCTPILRVSPSPRVETVGFAQPVTSGPLLHSPKLSGETGQCPPKF